MRRVSVFVGLLLSAVLFVGQAEAAGESWSATSSGLRVDWTDDDVMVVRNSDEAVQFSARKMADDGFRRVRQAIQDKQPDAAGILLERKISVISLAGSLLALRDEGSVAVTPAAGQGASPATSVRYWTLDIRKPIVIGDSAELWSNAPGPLVSLRDLFADDDLLAALQADMAIQKQAAGLVPVPDALEPFVAAMTANASVAEACKGIGAIDFTRFAIQGAQKDKIAVRLGIIRSASSCPDNAVQLGLYIPNRGAVTAALSGTAGMVRLPSRGMTPVVFSYRQGSSANP